MKEGKRKLDGAGKVLAGGRGGGGNIFLESKLLLRKF